MIFLFKFIIGKLFDVIYDLIFVFWCQSTKYEKSSKFYKIKLQFFITIHSFCFSYITFLSIETKLSKIVNNIDDTYRVICKIKTATILFLAL